MKFFIKTTLFCLLATPIFAQKTPKEPTQKDIQREMLEMQRQIMEQFKNMSPDGSAFSMPEFKWDTTFSFRFDTLFDGGAGGQFFFSPFGQDTAFFRNFFGDGAFGEGFQWSFPPGLGFPENEENSALEDPGDGLLPEERLRKEQEEGAAVPEKHAAPEQKKPKIKTIRI